MQLYALLENNAKTSLPDMEITGLTDDSRKVQPGMLFACIRGERFDGHTAAKDVLAKVVAANTAAAVVIRVRLSMAVPPRMGGLHARLRSFAGGTRVVTRTGGKLSV